MVFLYSCYEKHCMSPYSTCAVFFKSFSSFPVAAFTLSYNYDEILSQRREKLGLSHIDLRLVTKIVF